MPAGLPGAAGRYQLVGEIGRGGMGAVLKARDPDLGRDVALKVLLETHHNRPELARRFLEEAQIAGQLQHPGVTPVYELGVLADQRPYFAMKLVKGHTLAALLQARQNPAEDLPRFLTIFGQVCQTLAYAHARAVIHRDLKPANVMVGAFGEVQVMDWGLAKVLPEGGVADEERARRGQQPAEAASAIRTPRSGGSGTPPGAGSDTQAGSVLGTPAYMAPEQARGEVDLVDERADVFGLGAILCEVLTGQPPFTGKGAEAQRKAQTANLQDAYARLQDCGADAELTSLARRCLAAEPWERPNHAGELAKAVTAYQEAVAERLRQAELGGAEARAKAAEEGKRRKLMLALAAVVLLAVSGGAGAWALVVQAQAEQEKQKAQAACDKAERDSQAARDKAERDSQAAFEEIKRVRRVEAALGQARRQRDAGQWAEAMAQARRAEALLEGGPEDAEIVAEVRRLLGQLNEEDKDRRLLAALDAARLAQTEAHGQRSRFGLERAVPLYREALRAYGMPAGVGTPDAVAARLRQRPAVREALVASLDEWVMLAEEPSLKVPEPHLEWLRAVVAAADPVGWGMEVRRAAAIRDAVKRRAALEQLVTKADMQRLPARALTLLAARLWAVQAGSSAVKLLRRAQAQHPGDFWVNHDLGLALSRLQPAEGNEVVRYLTAAVALRPDSSGAHLNLGNALDDKGDRDGAIAAFRKAITLDPKDANAHTNLGNALYRKGDLGGAIAEYRWAIALDPKDAAAHSNLGIALQAQGDLGGAIAACRRAIALDPKLAQARGALGRALLQKGQFAEARQETQHTLDLLPARDPLRNSFKQQLQRCERWLARDQKLPAILQGKAQPANAGERLALAWLCLQFKKRYTAAARFYAEAFAADPKLADDFKEGYRYDAACAAALAAARQGNDTAQLKEQERAGWRKQAVTWLRADLARWAKQLEGGQPADRRAVAATMRNWQQDTKLANLRDRDAVAQLPAEEQKACYQLWADVAALRKKAGDGK
jgi:serine/threonine-protein kinase